MTYINKTTIKDRNVEFVWVKNNKLKKKLTLCVVYKPSNVKENISALFQETIKAQGTTTYLSWVILSTDLEYPIQIVSYR